MGLFTRRTKATDTEHTDTAARKHEARLAREQAKLDIYSGMIDAREELRESQRRASAEATAKNRVSLAKVGVDTRDATTIVAVGTIRERLKKDVTFVGTMPDSVVFWTVRNMDTGKLVPGARPVRDTTVIPYESIRSVTVSNGVVKRTITITTTGEAREFMTLDAGDVFADDVQGRL